MSYLDWHVGMKVVCVDGYHDRNFAFIIGPKVGCIYTIREIGPLCPCDPGIEVRLNEIVNIEYSYDGVMAEPMFRASRFRPALTRKTDISVFTAMLTSTKQKVPA